MISEMKRSLNKLMIQSIGKRNRTTKVVRKCFKKAVNTPGAEDVKFNNFYQFRVVINCEIPRLTLVCYIEDLQLTFQSYYAQISPKVWQRLEFHLLGSVSNQTVNIPT